MVSTTMEESTHSLASGNQFMGPSIFPSPSTGPQGELLLDFLMRYEAEDVGGILVDIGDWDTVGSSIHDHQSVLAAYNTDENQPLGDYPLIINPDFSPIMGYGGSRTVENFSESPFLPSEAEEIAAALLDEHVDNLDVREDQVYPMIESTRVIRDTMIFQSDNGADVVIPPTIPLRTKRDFESRVEVVERILETGTALAEGGLLPSDRQLMHIVSLKPSVFDMPEGSQSETKRWDRLVDMVTNNPPELFGVHIPDMERDDTIQNQNLLETIGNIENHLGIPILLINTREFGIPSLLYGVDVISVPIASDPYPRFGSQEGSPPTQLGSYYHPAEMVDLSREELMDEIRDENYRFPCHCEICDDREFFHSVPDDDWNDFRRIHYLLAKNNEIKQIRESEQLHSEAIRDKLANSQRGDLLSYLPG